MSKLVCKTDSIDNIELVIFDKDGTLIDIHHYWCSMIKFRAQHLCEKFFDVSEREVVFNKLVDTMGIDLKTNHMKPEGPVGLKPRSYIIDLTWQCLKKYSDKVGLDNVVQAFKQVDFESKNRLSEIVKPLPGVKPLLDGLRKKNIKAAIATTDLTERAKLAMAAINLENEFDLIAGADLVQQAKPSPDLAHYVCNTLKVDIAHSVVIGDSMADLKMADNANCCFIGVKTGLYTPDFLEQSLLLANDLNDVRSM